MWVALLVCAAQGQKCHPGLFKKQNSTDITNLQPDWCTLISRKNSDEWLSGKSLVKWVSGTARLPSWQEKKKDQIWEENYETHNGCLTRGMKLGVSSIKHLANMKKCWDMQEENISHWYASSASLKSRLDYWIILTFMYCVTFTHSRTHKRYITAIPRQSQKHFLKLLF